MHSCHRAGFLIVWEAWPFQHLFFCSHNFFVPEEHGLKYLKSLMSENTHMVVAMQFQTFNILVESISREHSEGSKLVRYMSMISDIYTIHSHICV